MKSKLIIALTILWGVIFTACGNVETETKTIIDTNPPAMEEVSPDPITDSGDLTIRGKVTFDKVGVNENRVGLDYTHIIRVPARQVIVKVIDSVGKTVQQTTTNDEGEYLFSNLSKNKKLKIRVYAQMKKSRGDTTWSVNVVDNTNGNSQYVMEGGFSSSGEISSIRNLNASLGWSQYNREYTKVRVSAPFAILDSIYSAMKKVIESDSQVNFPPLKVNWSVNNVSAGNGTESELQDGQIVTSHYDGENKLYILGDANADTDEFDNHIIIHEWGHYFESKFSRADSIGGPHSDGDMLDMRVAFGEGWGNAFSAIATDDPIYYDTSGQGQGLGWAMDIENDKPNHPGWYSESSIQRILYDLYDSHDDGADTLSLGFAPIYDVLVGYQKNTKAFTSIFSFITGLLQRNPSDRGEINAILQSEDISEITDEYGSSHHQLYLDMDAKRGANVCTSTVYGISNKVDTHKYMLFTLSQSGTYTIRLSQTNGRQADPDFGLYKTSPFELLGKAEEVNLRFQEGEYPLQSGDYILDVSDYNDLREACFNIDIIKNQ